jgi:hypothetical protein
VRALRDRSGWGDDVEEYWENGEDWAWERGFFNASKHMV